MLKRILTLSLVLTLTFGVITTRVYADNVSDAGNKAATYLLNHRGNDGGIGGVGYSSWALQGIVANRSQSAITANYLENNLGDIENAAATDIERTILGLIAGNKDPRNAAGKDLVTILKSKASNSQIGSATQTNDDIYGILALIAAGESVNEPIVANAIHFLVSTQRSNGSFSWSTSGDGDTNDTAVAIQALQLARSRGYTGSTGVTAAASYLQSAQNNDGGFGYYSGDESDGTSTATVIPAIIALGQTPESWVKNGNNPFQYLISLQAEDGGVKWHADSEPDFFSTSFAAIALARKALPVAMLTIQSPSPSPEPSPTPSPSPEPSSTPSPSPEPSATPSVSPSPSASPETSPSPSISPSPSLSPTPLSTQTPTPTPSVIASPSPSPSPLTTSTPSPSPSPVPSPTPSPSAIPTPSPSIVPTPTPTPSSAPATTTNTATNPSPTPSPVATPATQTITRTIIETVTKAVPMLTMDRTQSSPNPEISASPSPSPSLSPSPDASPTDDFTPIIKGDETAKKANRQTVAAALMILVGLILLTWAAIHLYRQRNRPFGG